MTKKEDDFYYSEVFLEQKFFGTDRFFHRYGGCERSNSKLKNAAKSTTNTTKCVFSIPVVFHSKFLVSKHFSISFLKWQSIWPLRATVHRNNLHTIRLYAHIANNTLKKKYPTELYGSVQKQQIPISTFIQSRKHQNIKGTVTLKGVQCGQL